MVQFAIKLKADKSADLIPLSINMTLARWISRNYLFSDNPVKAL